MAINKGKYRNIIGHVDVGGNFYCYSTVMFTVGNVYCAHSRNPMEDAPLDHLRGIDSNPASKRELKEFTRRLNGEPTWCQCDDCERSRLLWWMK